MRLFGLAILKNGIKYDYPFQESLTVLAQITEKIYLALGESEDDTASKLNGIKNLSIVSTVWDPKLREDGLILSQQTNLILNHARSECAKIHGAWGLYLQCDELILEQEFSKILQDISFAENNGFDAVSFRYLHFWQSFHKIAVNKKWYPSEIRAIKLNSPIESWGDAQSFRKCSKVFFSDAHIFHYGHVRIPEKYLLKKKDMLRLYHADEKINKYRRREKRHDSKTKCLNYYGPHPLVMRERMQMLGANRDIKKIGPILITHTESADSTFFKTINAQKIRLIDRPLLLKAKHLERTISWKCLGRRLPYKAESKLARPWDPALKFILTLSLAKIGCKKMVTP